MNQHRRARAFVVLAVALASLSGCRNGTICAPPWSNSGQIVKVRNSAAYVEQMEQASADVQHVACRAEATIPTEELYWRESEPTTYVTGPGMVAKNFTPQDPRIMMARKDIGYVRGEYRVMGVGRGMDAEDCARAAVQACDEAIDGYWRKHLAVRPLLVPCRLLQDSAGCPASGSYEPVALAPATPKLAARTEPPLVSLVKKLDDKRTRRDAVRGLVQFFENARTRADGDVGDPAVKALLDKIVEPLAATYVDGDVDDATRGELIRVLGESKDARAGRAWVRALTSFNAGKAGYADDAAWASNGVASTEYQEAAAALGEAFAKVEAGTPDGARASKKIRDAMIVLKSAAWKPMLVERIGRPIESATSTDSAAYKNELYRQTTAIEVLGEIRDPSATRALVKVMMDTHRKALEPAALVAIASIGKDAVAPLGDILAGKDAELVELGRARASENEGDPRSFVRVAATALGAIGRVEAKDPLVRASKAPDSPANHAAIARALTKLPQSADTAKAFQQNFEKATNANLKADLFEATVDLYDAGRVPWLLSQAKGAENAYVRQTALRSAIRLMRAQDVAAVKAAVDKSGGDAEKDAFAAASKLLDRCGTDVTCHLATLADPDAETQEAVKAATTIGQLGDTAFAMRLIARSKDIRSPAARLAALGAIDHLVQKDGKAAADALMKTEGDGADDDVRSATRLVCVRISAR